LVKSNHYRKEKQIKTKVYHGWRRKNLRGRSRAKSNPGVPYGLNLKRFLHKKKKRARTKIIRRFLIKIRKGPDLKRSRSKKIGSNKNIPGV